MAPSAKIDEFTRKYLEARPGLARLVRRILRYHTPEEIEDVLQDIWLKGSQAYAKSDVTYFSSWIGRTAINLSINRIRRFRREPQAELVRKGALPRQLIDRAPRADDLVLRREARDALEAIGARIPRQALTLYLLYVEGLSQAEAAERLGVAEGTIKSNSHKGLHRLRESLTAPKAA